MTGGEPLLAWQRLYIELFEHPRMEDLKNVTFETNSTQKLHEDFRTYLNNQGRFKVTGRVRLSYPFLRILGNLLSDPILSVITIALAIAICISNLSLLILQILMKCIGLLMNTKKLVSPVQSILCPLGGRSEEYNLNVKQVAEVCMERGWRFTIQDSTSVYSETSGVRDDGTASRIYDNEQHERAMKKDIDKDDLQQRIREAGY